MITVLSGSPRANSTTLRVSKAIKNTILNTYPHEEVNVIDFNEFDIPSLNQGKMDVNHLSEWQNELFQSVSKSHLVFVLTPEYNWFPSAEIIQMIHMMTASEFKDMWDNKTFATCGVSSGRGGRMPAVQLSYTIGKIISVFAYDSVISSFMFESQFSDKALDENGNSLGNLEYMKGLQKFIDSNVSLSQRWSSGQASE